MPAHVRQPEGGEAPAQPSSHPMFPTEGLVTVSPPNVHVGTSSPHHTSKLRPTHVAGSGQPEYQAPLVCPGLPTPALPMDSLALEPPAWKSAQSPSYFQAKVSPPGSSPASLHSISPHPSRRVTDRLRFNGHGGCPGSLYSPSHPAQSVSCSSWRNVSKCQSDHAATQMETRCLPVTLG